MSFLEKYLRVCAYALLLTPLLFSLYLSSPYIFTQVHFTQAVVGLSLVPLLFLWIFDQTSRPRLSFELLLLATFGTSLLMVNIASLNTTASYLGRWERFGGVIDWLYIYGYFFLLVTALRAREQWIFYFRTLVAIGTVVALFAWSQLFSLFGIYFFGARLFSTVGNPSFLSAYLLLVIGLTCYLLLIDRPRFRVLYGAAISIQTPILILANTRSTILGLAVAIVLMVLFFGFTAKKSDRKTNARRVSVLISLALSILVTFIVLSIDRSQVSAFTERYDPIKGSQTINSRLANWQMAVQGILERPWTGWGDNNYHLVFERYYDPRLYLGWGQSTFFDKPHNEFLERGVATGFFGLLSYLLFLATPLYCWLRRGRMNESETTLLMFLLGYYLYLLFFFHSIADTLIFFVYLAYFYHLQGPRQSHSAHGHAPNWLAMSALLISAGFVLSVQTRVVAASFFARAAERETDLQKKVANFSVAWSLSEQAREVAVVKLAQSLEPVTSPENIGAYEQLRDWTFEIVQKHPLDGRFLTLLARVYRNTSGFFPDRLLPAMNVSSIALSISPKDPQLYQLRGLIFLDLAVSTSKPAAKEQFMSAAISDFEAGLRHAPQAFDLNLLLLGTQGVRDQNFDTLLAYMEGTYLGLAPEHFRMIISFLYNYREKETLRAVIEFIERLPDPPYAFKSDLMGFAHNLFGQL